jgi:hypothetical protein
MLFNPSVSLPAAFVRQPAVEIVGVIGLASPEDPPKLP